MTADDVRERVARALFVTQGDFTDPEVADRMWRTVRSRNPRSEWHEEATAVLAALAGPEVVAEVAEVVLGVLHPHHDPDECSDEWHVAQADRVAQAVVERITGRVS